MKSLAIASGILIFLNIYIQGTTNKQLQRRIQSVIQPMFCCRVKHPVLWTDFAEVHYLTT